MGVYRRFDGLETSSCQTRGDAEEELESGWEVR